MYREEMRMAIVLHAQRDRSRITILDSTQGKNIFLCSDYLSAGSYIMYRISSIQGVARLILHDVFAIPLKLAAFALPFLHHVLELCDFGIPLGSHIPEVYDFLVWLCTEVKMPETHFRQELFVAKILMILGLHATRLSLCHLCTLRIHRVSVDTFDALDLDLQCTERLQLWIVSCLEEHVSTPLLRTGIRRKNYRTI
jgi:hypothetical protein